MAADLPTSRFGRFSRMAALGARVGAGKLASALGSTNAETDLAHAAADALGTMRGLALKIGQMASYVDGFVPEAQRDLYETTMRSLRAAAPAMSPEAAARVVEAELGAPPESLFDAWEPVPFASASIGQVHRAVFQGQPVAVKVQYEGVDRAVSSDLANASMFTSLAGPIGTKFGMKEQVAEMRARFEEELDYTHEASRQRRFASLFADEPRVRVPEVVDVRSSRRVLTSSFANGVDFEAACARSEAERRVWAETLWTFVFGSLLGHGLFNADPHPGNYRFADDGAIWFLDFGCTREVSAHRVPVLRAAHLAASEGRADEFVANATAMLDMDHLPETSVQRVRGREYLMQCFAPILTPGPYRLTKPYCKGLFDEMSASARMMATGSKKDFAALPAEWLFFNRLQLGFYSVLARLDVAVDYNAVERKLLARILTT